MVAKKSTAETEETASEEIKMEPFDKEYIVFETAYDTYKLRRPRGQKIGRAHLRLIQKWTSKLNYDTSMLEARNQVLKALIETNKFKPEEASILLTRCGLKEPANQMEIDNEQERQEKAEEEWFDVVLPEILVGKTVDDIPAEDYKPIFTAMYYGVKVRPDYFRLL